MVFSGSNFRLLDNTLPSKRLISLQGCEPFLSEQLTLNQRAIGSTPVRPTNKINGLCPQRHRPFFVGARVVLG